ncbi:MAG: hypothetical protein ACE5HT_13540 [Gemmatimonadales bacterium]
MSDPQEVASFRTRLEAEFASAGLTAAGIPFLIQSGEGGGYGPLPSGALILVRPEDADRARVVLAGEAETGVDSDV